MHLPFQGQITPMGYRQELAVASAYISGRGMAWSTRRNPVDDAFAYHDHRRMGATRPGDARHHRGISHPQSFDALDPAVLVNDRQRICIRSHLTGPGYVPGGTRGLTYPEVQSVVAGQNVRGGVDPVIDYVFIHVGFQQPRCQSQAFPHPSNVVWVLEITIIEGRLDAGIGRGQPDVPRAVGQPERAMDPCRPLRWNVTDQVLGAYTGDALLPFVDDRAGPQHHIVDGARPFGGVVQTEMRCIAMCSQGDAVFDLEGRLCAEVVHQVLADARKMTNHGYPELLQVVFRADAGEHQQVRRSDRAGAQHHPVGFHTEHLAAAFGFHADGLAILDHDLPDEHPAAHRQVQMMAHWT